MEVSALRGTPASPGAVAQRLKPTSGRRPWRTRRPSGSTDSRGESRRVMVEHDHGDVVVGSCRARDAARRPTAEPSRSHRGWNSPASSDCAACEQARFTQQLSRRIGGLDEGIGIKDGQIAGAERQVERLVAGCFIETQRQVAAVVAVVSCGREQRPLRRRSPDKRAGADGRRCRPTADPWMRDK